MTPPLSFLPRASKRANLSPPAVFPAVVGFHSHHRRSVVLPASSRNTWRRGFTLAPAGGLWPRSVPEGGRGCIFSTT